MLLIQSSLDKWLLSFVTKDQEAKMEGKTL